jgi:hypothetical protein
MDNNTYIPISDLPALYKVSRQTVYDRMKFLNISTTKMEGKNYITNDDLLLMDSLNQHLSTGADKSLFDRSATQSKKIAKPKSAIVKQAPQSITVADSAITEPIPTQLPIPDLIEQLARAIASKQSDPLCNYDALEKACSNSWIISTQKIQDLIGVKPHGSEYVWGSWKFIAKGKLGRGKGWMVEKVDV